ncbi:protein translocase subunit SecD [Commensalibacter oyaizuii]|uniref:Protein translocase subunit SecD n=1 Tax=Commensalibacter oyaizuii TaxID=3043873 RepID=A0ABT6PZ41_9PROT|nr:protein translocase subunit SecD [Commensalibacter sp. TBRC 16381]MDI2090125.1 protein translocase subunit SecD [Commensalibacter sp. TBRC 16381]
MMYYSRKKLALVILTCFIGLLLCLPNFMSAPSPKIPWRQVHLGLDLRGGSYLLMQVDVNTITKNRLQTLSDNIRQTLISKNLGYKNIHSSLPNHTITFTLRSPSEKEAVLKALREMPKAVMNEFNVSADNNNQIILTLSEEAMKQRASEAITQSIEIVRRRIDATGAVDPSITRQGDDRIVVQLPGISDPNRIKQLLGTTAKMTFHLLDETATNPDFPPPGVTFLPMADDPARKLPVRDHIEVDGAELTSASAGMDQQNGEYAVNFQFDTAGAQAFASVTRANVGKPFAIVLDNKVITAPVINTPITGGSGQITGHFTPQQATDLALLLRAGALPAPLKVMEERTIGPSLGLDAIKAGGISLAVGFALVIVFMLVFYGRFGFYADIALFANLILMTAILSLFQATLTLPGMAGMLLTLGMAVDANILINERIREEVRNGRNPLNALQAGFDRALSTIIDSNVTAFLSHVMLFIFGTGPVRGFALTITIGIVTTLFTTLCLSWMLIIRWYAVTRPKELPI